MSATIDRSGWKRVRLGDIAGDIRTGKRNGNEHITNGKYPFFIRSQEVQRINSYSYDGEAILIPGEGGIGNIFHYIKGRFDFHQRVYKVSSFSREVNAKFLFYCMQRNFGPWALSQTSKAAVDSIRMATLQQFELALPPMTVQNKIYTALTSIDTHISALQSLIAKYEAIKKATVNLLLKPKAGWRCVKLRDVCNRFSYGVGASAVPYDGINKYIRITDIDDLSRAFAPSPLSSPSHFTDDHIVNEGDILFARTGASVGKSYLYNPGDGKLIFAGFLIRASINSDVVDPHVLFLQTLTDRYWQWVAEESMRSGQPGLNINQYKELDICIPLLSEQRKIAEKIIAIDNALADYKAQLEKARQLKTGMMSYFFG